MLRFALLLFCSVVTNFIDAREKVIFITGTSSGIGFHTSVHLANQGFKVYAGLLDPNQDGNRLKSASYYPQNLIPIQLNIVNHQQIAEVVDEIVSQEGRIDVLINNAAYGLFGPMDTCTMKEIEDQFRVNLFGTIELTHAVIPHFRRQMSGHIICISSTRSFNSSSIQGAYSATKSALEAIGLSWASTLFPWNIHVTLVEPDATATSFPENMVIGSFYQGSENPYLNLMKNGLRDVQSSNEFANGAQDPKEIAVLIQQLLTSEHPPLRVQTNSAARDTVEQFSRDSTGSIWLETEKKLVNKWLSQ